MMNHYFSQRIRGFYYALQGLGTLWKEQPHFRIHLLAGFLVVMGAWILALGILEWAILLICMGLVMGLEALNSSLEYACNAITLEDHPLIKKAKDVSAAAVLIMSVVAFAIGLTIFIHAL